MRQPLMPHSGTDPIIPSRLGVIATTVLLIGGTVISCSRPETLSKDDVRFPAKPAVTVAPPVVEPTTPTQALMEAAQLGDAKEVETLLARGFDRNTLNEALFMVARSEPMVLDRAGQEELGREYATTARLLLNKGASVRARDEDGRMPLAVAARKGETAVVKLLLEYGAEIEATGNFGETALIAAACRCPSIDQPDTEKSVRLLLDRGANLEAADKEGETALMAAAGWGRDWIVKILLDRGAKIEAADKKGNTALLIAARGQGYPTANAVKVLLERGADIEARNKNGETALMLAASHVGSEDFEIVRMLLNRGADLRATDRKGRTAMGKAAARGRTEVVSLLRSARAKSK